MQDWTPAERHPSSSAPDPKPAPRPASGQPPAPKVPHELRVPRLLPPPPPAGFPGNLLPASGPVPGPSAAGAWRPLDIPPDISRLGLHVGTSGYQFDDWAGRFYPPGPGRERYPFYQLYFSFLEISHTFNQEPMIQQFAELERRSKPGMMFSVKVHRDISHKGTWDARASRSLMRKHAEAVAPLVEAGRFYSFLIQLDEALERDRKALDYLLETASAAISEGLDVHVEFRNRTWHQEAVLQSLKDAGVGICNTDRPDLPDAFPLKTYATTDKAYVRYGGRDHRYSLAELEERVRGQILLLKKTGSVASVFSNHGGANAALNAVQDIHLLLRNLGPGR
ncbi:MAG: hypothetical protein JWP91_4709 [Fibrobacteres bacterium]|nr:hypothetical protein [Fibrobacterota bacterium]